MLYASPSKRNSVIERIRYLCRICNILDDIEELPDKFDTIVSEKGDSFSGGQKSRLCLVRALYKNLPVLIIDEITARLDGITERKKQERYRCGNAPFLHTNIF